MGDRSNKTKLKQARHVRAHRRIRKRISGTAERPRLAVHKSLKYLYAQVIDDQLGVTLAAASSAEPALKEQLKGKAANRAAAQLVGTTIAARAKEKGFVQIVFDRGGYVYHGKVKALAEAAREGGLEF